MTADGNEAAIDLPQPQQDALHGHPPSGVDLHAIHRWIMDMRPKSSILPTERYAVSDVQIINDMCPFELEAITSDGRPVYVRQRFFALRIDVDNETVFLRSVDRFDGYEDLKTLTSQWFAWPQ